MADVAQSTVRNPETKRERSDVPLWTLGLVAGIVAGSVAIVVGLLLLIYPGATGGQPKAPTAAMPAPQLQPDPAGDMRGYRRAAHDRLTSYGWVDRDKGIAHIPIDEAMHRIAERGIQDWPAQQGAAK
jgi:hypothetical protein